MRGIEDKYPDMVLNAGSWEITFVDQGSGNRLIGRYTINRPTYVTNIARDGFKIYEIRTDCKML